MSRIIKVIVSPKGETTVHTTGYASSACLQASKFLEEALGVVTHERKTSEFFQSEEVQQQLNQQQ